MTASRTRLPIVLLHFFGSSRREWATAAGHFGPDRRVLALDLPGFGDAADASPVDVAGMVEHVDRRIVDAGLTSCVVVGHSMSGKVAAVLASHAPGYLRGLVLVAASPPSPEPMSTEAREKLLAFDGGRQAAADYIDGITATRLPDAPRELAIGDAMRASPSAWQAWATQGSREDWSSTVGASTLPTLVIAGASDPSLGEAIQRDHVMPHFPSARLAVIPGGHVLPLENPDDLCREIDLFLATIE